MGRQLDIPRQALDAFKGWLDDQDPVKQIFYVFQSALDVLEVNESLAAVYALNNPLTTEVSSSPARDIIVKVTVQIGEAHVVVGAPTPVPLASVEIKRRRLYSGMYSFFGFRGFDPTKLMEMAKQGIKEGFTFYDGSLFQRPKLADWDRWAIEIRGRLEGSIPLKGSIEE